MGEERPWELKGVKFEIIDLNDIVPYVNNPKTHPERQIQALMSSIKQFGYVAPIIVDKDNVIIAGHGRYEALKRLGYKKVPVIRADHLTPEQVKAYRIADNRIAELGRWDEELLVVELEDLKGKGIETGFTDKEIEKLLTWIEEFENKEEAPEENVEIPRITKPGDIWELGPHRVICGDSTKRGTYERLLGSEKVNLVFTSPPYAEQRREEYGGIPTEEYPEWFAKVAECVREYLKPNGSFFVNIKEHVEDGERTLYFFETIKRLRSMGWRYVDRFIWYKRGGLPTGTEGRLKDEFEDIHWLALSGDVDLVVRLLDEEGIKILKTNSFEGLVFVDSYTEIYHFALEKKIKWRPRAVGKVGKSFSSRSRIRKTLNKNVSTPRIEQERRGIVLPSNVLQIKPNTEKWGHPAMFPVELPAFFIRLTTEKGDIVMDIFNGAGTTLMASHQLGRTYRGIELMPEFVDITVKRFISFVGDTSEVYLIRDGEKIPYKEAKTFSQS